MSPQEVEKYLQLPHVAVLSVSREGRGPIAAPVWYDYVNGSIRLITSRNSIHGKAMERLGWATLTVRSEVYGDQHTIEQYANVEGPISFVDGDLRATATAIRSRYYTGPNAETWIDAPVILTQEIAVLQPERKAGFYWEASI